MDFENRKLELLTNDELNQKTLNLAQDERHNQALMICHLVEIERRSLHLALGYSSLYRYCIERLGLCEGNVYLRLQIARVAVKFPVILDELCSGKSSLTVLGKISRFLTGDNYLELLQTCRGMTKREVEALIVRFSKKPVVSDGIKRAGKNLMSEPLPSPLSENQLAETFASPDPKSFELSPTPQPAKKATMEPATPERFNIRFSVDQTFKAKLERLAEVRAHAAVS